jgi:DNA-binding winged helix-turn-helix (wHTH) protein
MRISFGDCTLDLERRQLLRAGAPVALTPKALLLLEALLAARPRALAKAELFERLWPGAFVSEASLSVVVAALRKAIGDHAGEPRFLRTVHGFGYAWCGEAVEEGGSVRPAAAAGCSLLWRRHEIPLRPGENVLGRARGADLVVDDPGVSRHHARIVVAAGTATLEDLGSKNGTSLNGRKLAAPAVLADGDTIAIGPVTLVFHSGAVEASTMTRRG